VHLGNERPRTVPTHAVAGDAPVPARLRQVHDEAFAEAADLLGPDAAKAFASCLMRTWRTCLRLAPGDAFVITGDIPAMWLRDAVGQMRPYLVAADDAEVSDVLAAVSKRMSRLVLTDPRANAFNDGPTGAHPDESDEPPPAPSVWERKYEVDSPAAHLTFAYQVWRGANRVDHLDQTFWLSARAILDMWEVEQDHEERSDYTFARRSGPFAHDTLDRDGRGAPVARTGMTWSGFRPSDDRCELGYLVPANAAAVVALEGLADLAAHGVVPPDLGTKAQRLAVEIANGIAGHGIVDGGEGPVYAYEVDGRGGSVVMDDANVPSLLSLPYLGWTSRDEPLYLRTRSLLLSSRNPFWYSGSEVSGIGSPHTPPWHVWPIALCMQALTETERDSSVAVLNSLLRAWAGEPGMCESFHVDDPWQFTRDWFCWADSLFAELVLSLTSTPVPTFLPPRLPGVAAAQAAAGLRDATTDREADR
jgi:meiotically up-regulated gene 157 (Mug157) protein